MNENKQKMGEHEINNDEQKMIAHLEISSRYILQEMPSNQLGQSVRGQKKMISKN